MTREPTGRAWYRSLYWRIALGFILCLAGVLVAQGALFLWAISRSGADRPSPRGLAALAAVDLSAALAQDPALNVAEYLEREHGGEPWPLFVVTTEGLVFTSRDAPPPPERLIALAHASLQRQAGRPARAGRGRRRPGLVPIVVEGRMVGLVGIIPASPLAFTLARFGPTLIGVGVAILAIGTALTAFFIFRPARRRLEALEDAARRLGAGDLAAQVPAQGGDEISAVAQAFNSMASDLRKRSEQVRASEDTRRQLLADVSHELTTPLTAMRGYVETLSMPDLAIDELTRERYLDIISQETLRLERIVGDLLDLSRLESGGGTLEVEDVMVSDLFARVVARHERECRNKGVDMAVAIDSEAETLRGDAHRLEQALQNLAANALRHTPAGGRVQLTATRQDGRLALCVQNTGQGIPSEHLPHVFERFYKVDASRGGTPAGSGLGLSIVKAIVERHGGTITAARGSDGGTRFEMRLPVAIG